MTAPTLPGSIPGLLRRGSPVVVPVSARVRAVGLRALVGGLGVDHDGVWVITDNGARWEAPADVALDLSDSTGRAHAAWWLAAWWETHRGNGAPSEVPLRGCVWNRCGLTSWRLMWSGCAVTFDPEGCGDAATYVAVPSLADQPGDAEALRRVCLHVAGVTP